MPLHPVILALLLSLGSATTDIPIAENYRAFGPLPYTSSARGANPLASLSRRPLLDAVLSLTTFPSESAIGGHAKWREVPYNASAKGIISVPFPDADPHLPYEAYAIADFSVHVDPSRPVLLQCSHPASITLVSAQPGYESLVKSDPANDVTQCPEDAYEDGRGLCVARLVPGTYRIMVHIWGQRNVTQFFCNYFTDPAKLPSNLLLPINDSVTPDIIFSNSSQGSSAALAGAHCSVTLMNTHHRFWATAGTAELYNAPPGLSLAAHSESDSHYPLPRIAPRQIRQLRIDLLTDSTFLQQQDDNGLPPSVDLTIVISYDIGERSVHNSTFHLSLDVAVWRRSRSYRFTYVDIDGSVQAAAVLPPRYPCVDSPSGEDACKALLSTHGAGVDATASAWTDSYKVQNQSWVLLPTGRRKYGLNWEGPQLQSAVTALNRLAENLPGVPVSEKHKWKVRNDFWLQAGHSMGGHGALLLSTHYPDMLAAALPAMGWLRLSTYSEEVYEAQLPFSDAIARALLTISSAEYSADLYAENLLGIPFLARVGSDDDNVPPSNLRKFYRLLKQNEFFANRSQSVVDLSEVPGKGHWFDGVVDDEALQSFIEKHLSSRTKPALPKTFSLVTINPASSGSRGGFSVLQLVVPFQLARITVKRDTPRPGAWTLQTENVRRMRYNVVFGIEERPEEVFIDESATPIGIPSEVWGKSNKHVEFCAYAAPLAPRDTVSDGRAVQWKKCSKPWPWSKTNVMERGPHNSGPAAQVLAERKVVVVFPEGDTELQDTAVAYSNSLYIRGISAHVTTDSNVSVGQLSTSGDSNMILLGGPNMNHMAKRLASEGYIADISFEERSFCLASAKCFEDPGTGVAFLSPGPKQTLLFYVGGTDRDGVLAALSFLPLSPASNVPEWLIVSKQRGWGYRGLGGVAGLGYWDHRWKLDVRKLYPAELDSDLRLSRAACPIGQGTSYNILWWLIITVVITTLITLTIQCRKRLVKTQRYGELSQDDNEERAVEQIPKVPQEKEVLLGEANS